MAVAPLPMHLFPHRLATLPAQRWIALLLTVWLAGAQLMLVLHQVDHLVSDDDETCMVCLVGHGLDHSGTTSVAIPPVLVTAFLVATGIVAIARRVSFLPYRSRAPPR
ncbi:MAG: hypothetical protein KDI42_06660 [Gammaproteobacteria bacterium]|nr:hypothetical protein [Gammaproteobacteria bacterium]